MLKDGSVGDLVDETPATYRPKHKHIIQVHKLRLKDSQARAKQQIRAKEEPKHCRSTAFTNTNTTTDYYRQWYKITEQGSV